MTRAQAWGRMGLVLGAVLVLDQVTKALVRRDVAVGDENGVFPAISLVHVRNDGIAFGALGGASVLVAIAVGVALVGLLAYFVTHTTRRLAWLPTGLLLGGAVGNVLDRLRDGVVTDFIKLPHWPAFNVADMAITVGVLALVYVLDEPSAKDGADAAADHA